MTAKRIAAVLIAAALIVAAVLIRNGLDDNSSSATDSTDKPQGGAATVVCSTEFKAVCDQLPDRYTVTIEPAGITLDRLAKDGAVPPDAWITLDPFPAMVDESRTSGGLEALAPTVSAAATDDPVLAIATSRVGSFHAGCDGKSAWRCIGGFAGQPWAKLLADEAGVVKVGITNPATEADGLLTFGTAVAGYFGGTDFSSNQFTDDSAFTPWMRTMSATTGVSTDRPPLPTLLTQPTFVNVAATTRSQAESSPQPDKFTTIDLTPAFQYIAVVATYGSRANGLSASVAPLLTKIGWVAATDPKPQLSPGTFIALRKLWKDFK